MKKVRWILFFAMMIFAAVANTAQAQCSICTKSASQLGEKPARGLNTGIVYLMLTPFAIAGYIGFRWWQGEKEHDAETE